MSSLKQRHSSWCVVSAATAETQSAEAYHQNEDDKSCVTDPAESAHENDHKAIQSRHTPTHQSFLHLQAAEVVPGPASNKEEVRADVGRAEAGLSIIKLFYIIIKEVTEHLDELYYCIFEVWVVQNNVNLVDLVMSFPTNISCEALGAPREERRDRRDEKRPSCRGHTPR